jgi:hypothetical protein
MTMKNTIYFQFEIIISNEMDLIFVRIRNFVNKTRTLLQKGTIVGHIRHLSQFS